MDTPLYKLFFFKRNASYYGLSEAEWAQMRAQITAQQKALGIRDLFNAQMGWSNERFESFGVEFYPSLEAVQTYTRCLFELGYYKLVDSESYLGLPMDNSFPDFTPEPPTQGESPVYRAYLAHETAFARQMEPQELESKYNLAGEAFKSAGGMPVLSAYMRWNNEGYEYFGIERYPNLEALIGYTQFLSSNDWYRIMESRSYLGTAYSGIISGVDHPHH